MKDVLKKVLASQLNQVFWNKLAPLTGVLIRVEETGMGWFTFTFNRPDGDGVIKRKIHFDKLGNLDLYADDDTLATYRQSLAIEEPAYGIELASIGLDPVFSFQFLNLNKDREGDVILHQLHNRVIGIVAMDWDNKPIITKDGKKEDFPGRFSLAKAAMNDVKVTFSSRTMSLNGQTIGNIAELRLCNMNRVVGAIAYTYPDYTGQIKAGELGNIPSFMRAVA